MKKEKHMLPYLEIMWLRFPFWGNPKMSVKPGSHRWDIEQNNQEDFQWFKIYKISV